jgi:hypothetical protein
MLTLVVVTSACSAPLLPGERVVGVDVPARRYDGVEGSLLGASVATEGGAWLAAAPGAGELWRDGVATDGSAVHVGFWDGRLVRVDAEGRVIVDEEVLLQEPRAFAWASGGAGLAAATPSGLWLLPSPDGAPVRVALNGVRAVAADDHGAPRWLVRRCAGADCTVDALSADGALQGAVMAAPGDGAIGAWAGRVWAGDPDWDGGAGRVCADDGACVAGLEGDGLGASLGGGFAAGVFNSRIVPARARVVALDGADVLTLETGAELQPLALAGDDGQLVVGAPYHAVGGAPAGSVWVLTP